MDNKIMKLLEITKKNGGVSFNSKLEILNDLKGYTISIARYEYKTKVDNISEIQENIRKKIDIINKLTKNYFIGLWIDNGILYIDINKIELNKTRSLQLAKREKQLAIYDNINNKTIYLKKEYTYILYKYILQKDDILNIQEFTTVGEVAKYFSLRDGEYLKKFIYNDFNNNISKYFSKNGCNYIIIKEAL